MTFSRETAMEKVIHFLLRNESRSLELCPQTTHSLFTVWCIFHIKLASAIGQSAGPIWLTGFYAISRSKSAPVCLEIMSLGCSGINSDHKVSHISPNFFCFQTMNWQLCNYLNYLFPTTTIIVVSTISDKPTTKRHVKTKHILISLFQLNYLVMENMTRIFTMIWVIFNHSKDKHHNIVILLVLSLYW